MEFTRLEIPEVVLFSPKVYADNRGFFYESFKQSGFEAATGLRRQFPQENHSSSQRGVLRGLHYQLPPKTQGKLVRVVKGEVLDVAVDLRTGSPTFAKWVATRLSAENRCQLWIPEGFAHGFVTLSETAEFLYRTTDEYAPEYERCIAWDDPAIGIDWQLDHPPVLSPKDRLGVPLAQADVFIYTTS